MSVAFGMDGRFTHVAHRREFGYFVVTTYVDCINLILPLFLLMPSASASLRLVLY